MIAWEYGKLFDDADSFLKYYEQVKAADVTISAVHVHHTYVPSHKDFTGSNYRQLQDGMRNYHLSKGWITIGQHITIFPDGKIMTGRNPNIMPASALGYNGTDKKHPFMFETLGNFDFGHDKLEGKQLDTVLAICRYFYAKSAGIEFHNQCLIHHNGEMVSPKTCPGTSVNYGWFMGLVKKPVVIDVPAQVTIEPVTPPVTPAVVAPPTIPPVPQPVAPTTTEPTTTPTPKPPIPHFVRDLKFRLWLMRGYDVQLVQKRLGIKVDGWFGVATRRAVISFQKENGLVPDGVVGVKTWAKLFG